MKRIKTPSIVQPSRSKRLLGLLLFLTLLLLQGWQLFDYGRVQGGFESERAAQETRQYMQQIDEQQQAAADLRVQTARYRREAQVEREAGRRLQQELIQRRKEGDELKSEVALLRSLISTKSSSLYIKRFEIHSTETADKYRYQLIVAQALDNVGTTKGTLTIGIIGRQGGKSRRIGLKQFSEDAVASIVLEFKHYQEVNGFINLPDDFKPASVEMEIKPKKAKLGKMRKRFDWKVMDAGSSGQEGASAGT